MNIIEHGKWIIYQADDALLERRKLTRQHGVVFCKHTDTQQDWYDFRDAFAAGSGIVLVTMGEQYDGLVTGAASSNPNFIFPHNGWLIEIQGYTGSDPQADFGNKIYDPEEQTFTDRPPMPPPPELVELRAEVAGMKKMLERLVKQ